MIEIDLIKQRVELLEMEESRLRQAHNELLQEHQQRTEQVRKIAEANTARLHQISGAVITLKSLLNGAEKEKPETQTKKEKTT